MKTNLLARDKRGDTLVEVLLATVILSIVLAGAYTLSNRATRLNQQAFERTQVSNLMQQQAEYIRSLRDSEDPQWRNLLNAYMTAAPPPSSDCKNVTPNEIATLPKDKAFHISDTGGSISAVNGALIDNNRFYVWTYAVVASRMSADFVINACWEGIGSGINNQSGMVLRIDTTPIDVQFIVLPIGLAP